MGLVTKCRHTHRVARARGLCGSCYGAQLRAEKPDHAERVRAKNRAFYAANRDAQIAYHRDQYHNGPGRSRTWASNIRKKYGLTVAEYDRMWAAQAGCCAVCGRAFTAQTRRAAVDHCHQTGKIRALLCTRCNTALGAVQDDALTLRALADYLEAHR